MSLGKRKLAISIKRRHVESRVLLLRCWLRSNCRRYVGINPERGTKAGRDKVLSKKTECLKDRLQRRGKGGC
ncbi:hypothetical protein SKAU_G00385590 [Synaphobranchus kaupii]|uniref:Uncharacterized protein n=1 Tax=Synaphobranchus kaupii TaxID=118154 RepID=A0A9Q1EEI6_SYNKA|nr:hypothetical protein SKAU_G00385590 [Synaphobranchus kaupii]